jgi:DNA-binding XRE family transcriptional regulator
MGAIIERRQRGTQGLAIPGGRMANRNDPLLTALGFRVRQLREGKRWTQKALAERADLDRSYVAGIEAGLRNPSVKAVARIARVWKRLWPTCSRRLADPAGRHGCFGPPPIWT